MRTKNGHVGRLAAVLLVAVMVCGLLPVGAFAATSVETSQPASLTVKCEYDGRQLAGVVFDIYKVADMDGAGRFYNIDPSFRRYQISLVQESGALWRALAETLAQYVQRDGVPALAQERTGADGKATFRDLTVGLYLVRGHRYQDGVLTYDPEPFLISLPNLDAATGEWEYEAEVESKGEGHENPPTDITVKVLKVWQDEGHETNRPAEIEVQLLRDGAVYGTVVLSAGNSWRYTWTNLDAGHVWSVIEKTVPEAYTLLVSREGITYVLTNTYEPSFTEIEVEKEWKDSGHEKARPEGIEVQLLRDGEVYETVILNGGNDWSWAWSGLEAGHDWTVKEKTVPKGYAADIKQNGGKYTITNTYTPQEPKLPQTGQLWWPIPVLFCAGMLSFVIGFFMRRKNKNETH